MFLQTLPDVLNRYASLLIMQELVLFFFYLRYFK